MNLLEQSQTFLIQVLYFLALRHYVSKTGQTDLFFDSLKYRCIYCFHRFDNCFLVNIDRSCVFKVVFKILNSELKYFTTSSLNTLIALSWRSSTSKYNRVHGTIGIVVLMKLRTIRCGRLRISSCILTD